MKLYFLTCHCFNQLVNGDKRSLLCRLLIVVIGAHYAGKVTSNICGQCRSRSVCAFAQSDPSDTFSDLFLHKADREVLSETAFMRRLH